MLSIKKASENYAQESWGKRHIMNDNLRIAFMRGVYHTASLVDEFLRLNPEYRCLDVIGKFTQFLNKNNQ